jgi:hypothetical protein
MTPGDIVLGILMVSSVVGLVTTAIAMDKAFRAGKTHVVGIVCLKKAEKEKDDGRPAPSDNA